MPDIKYAIVLPDGAADEPVESLGGRTPLDAANSPHMDWIAANGRQGTVRTVPDGFVPGTDVATMSLLGYDPRVDHSGRAPLEAAGRRVPVRVDQIVFRCNFVTIGDGVMRDFTAGHISQGEADRLIADLNERFTGEGCTFHVGVSYRCLMVASNLSGANLKCTPPHDIPDEPIDAHRPRGTGKAWALRVMELARDVLRDHDVNVVRRDLGENPATDIWLWGQGRARSLERFSARFGVHGTVVAAVDLIRGLARTVGLNVLDVSGATGYLDTDYAAKGAAAAGAVKTNDLVIVHIEAPDEAGHLGDVAAKVTAIERIDEHIVGPLIEALRGFGKWRILIAPDHPTPVNRRVHTATPPPFCLAGHMVPSVLGHPFCEAAAVSSDLHVDPGHELMEYFLRS